MVTFLSKLGSVLAKGLAVFTGVWPLVSPYFGSNTKIQQAVSTGVNDLTAIGQIVVQAEAIIQTPGSGAQKLAAAAPLVANVIKTSEMISGHQIANEKQFIQGCTDLTSAVAEILNSLSPNSVNTAPGPAVTPIPPAIQKPVPAPAIEPAA